MNKKDFFKKNIEKNKKLNFITEELSYDKEFDGVLKNYFYVIKDNICMKDTITTAGSAFLKNYTSPFDSTVVKLLNEAGAKPIAKSNMDEFGMGGTGTLSAFGDVLNPYDNERISGGSSSGSAVAVAVDACDFSLGTDTGDSIRKPASFCGVIGYKPSYGLISRYGVIPYSPSLDHVGLFSKKIKTIFDVMNVISKKDSLDYSSQSITIDFSYKELDIKKLKIVILEEMYEELDEQVKNLFDNAIKKINSNISKISFGIELIKSIPSIYKIISYSEAVSCYQSFSGMTFGEKEKGNSFEEITKKTRSNFLGKEVKRRFTIGAYCTSFENYSDIFLKSKKVRTMINNRISEILEKNHFLLTIGSSTIAPKIEDVRNGKVKDINADNILQIANFSGFPSITIPLGKLSGMPIGINITSRLNTDDYLLSFAIKLKKILKGVNHD